MTIRTTLMPMAKKGEAYEDGELFFESNTPGTYTVTPKTNCYCEATVIAAGAGGAYNSSSNRSSAAPGSSGSGCIVRIWLKASITYTIKVGEGGVKNGGVDYNCWGGTGENSSISLNETPLINAPGGNGGHVWWPNAAAAATQPEACSFAADNANFEKIEVVMNERGRSGGTSTGPGGASVLSGTTHGKGGSATQAGGASAATAGNPGYVKLVFVKVTKKYYRHARWLQPQLADNGIMGGETFAVACSTPKDSAYQCFNNGSDWSGGIDTYSNAAPQWLSFYNPVPLKVTKLRLGQIKNTSEQNNYYITSWKIQVSDDNAAWTDVWSGNATKPAQTLVAEIADSGYHKYYRIYVGSANYYSGHPRVFFNGVDFEASEKKAATVQDYDFVEYQFSTGGEMAETRGNLGGGERSDELNQIPNLSLIHI